MFCPKCGQAIPPDAVFCPSCGAKVQPAPEAPASGSPAQQSESPAPPVPAPSPSAPPSGSASTLAAVVGPNAAYYLPEFEKVEASQPTRFNLAAFFIGPYLCLYRRCFELFKKYFLLSFILYFVGLVLGVIGFSGFDATLLIVCIVVMFGAGILTLVNSIRLGLNFNREYYRHCKAQAAMAPAVQKRGVSVKNVVLFVLVLVGAGLLCGFIQVAVLRARLTAAIVSAAEDLAEDPMPAASTELPSAPEEDLYAYAEPVLMPTGTYQVIIGRSGVVSSIRLYENSSEYEDVWYCDVITWGGGPDIADSYYGPATVTDDLQTIICGDYTFSIDENGEPYFNDVLSEMSYGITYYSDDISMETGLNALIDMGNLAGNTLTQYAIDNYVETYGLDPSLLIDTER